MFKPKYTISSELLANIKKISSLITQLNVRTYPHIILHKYEQKARDLSAHASTSIEGNPLALTDVKALLKSRPENIRDTEREVLNYNNALIWLEKELKQSSSLSVTHEVIHKIHTLVMDNLMTQTQLQDYRNESVFINDPREHKTVYWPPDQQDVKNLMKELIEFIHHSQKDMDPLLVSGIFHKEFVIIHPYIDGNGRTVRLMTKALFASMGLNTFNLFSFENYYNNNVTNYFKHVGERGNYYDIADVDFTPWLVYFTRGIIDELLRVSKELDTEMITPQTVLADYEKEMLAYIDTNGFITDKIYSTLTKRAKATRNLDFQRLISMRIIRMEGKGKATYYKRV
ncbi:Fic family protein [Candidatus Gottesmanbacteria bacterium]|nr:Fic family protein [Candidatus Gottesmanbacteria bacterium]